MKGKVYASNPQMISQLKNEIRHVIGEIELQLCENVIKNFIERVEVCKQSGGRHLPDIVLHV